MTERRIMGKKVIKDLIHSYITIDIDVQKIVDTPSFQRLKRIKQLTCEYLFPSLNHTRYEHSLGVMKLACDFFDSLNKNMEDFGISKEQIKNYRFHIKFAALLHDVGHAPLSHLGESFYDKEEIYKSLIENLSSEKEADKIFKDKKENIVGSPHELMSCLCIIRKLRPALTEMNPNINIELICRIIIGNQYHDKNLWLENILIEIVNSKTIDVDKLDYLIRDNHMSGYIAPRIDIERLFSCTFIGEDKKLKYSSKAIPAMQSVVDSRDLLYLWVYNHHISVYTEFIIRDILGHFMQLYEEQNGKYPEEMNKKEFFSTEAIIDNLVIDDDIYSHLRKAYLASLKGKTVEYTSVVMKQLMERKFLKPLWKTIYEYECLEDELELEKLVTDRLDAILKDNEKIKKIVGEIGEALNLKKGEIFIITRYNKFYHAVSEAKIYVSLNGEDKLLSDLLPQKSFKRFSNISFYIFGPGEKKEEIKKLFLKIIKNEL